MTKDNEQKKDQGRVVRGEWMISNESLRIAGEAKPQPKPEPKPTESKKK